MLFRFRPWNTTRTSESSLSTTAILPPDNFVKASSSSITASTDYCLQYDGVLWISQGDRNGAAGTIFFLFLLNQLLYAEKYNLQPWIHLTNESKHVYDDQIHSGHDVEYEMGPELEIQWKEYQDGLALPDKKYVYPGRPIFPADPNYVPTTSAITTKVKVTGTGVWNSYFESIIQLKLGSNNRTYNVDITKPCPRKPFVHFQSNEALVQGLHLNCPYCVRSWRYGGMPPTLAGYAHDPQLSYQTWWHPMRKIGHQMVSKYYHPLPYLWDRVQQTVPKQQIGSSGGGGGVSNNVQQPQQCLAMHIRHSDKANKRDKIPLAAFLPYCQAYVDTMTAQSNQHFYIYLATDSSRIVDKIQTTWPAEILKFVQWQDNIVRSSNTTAVFDAVLQQEPQQEAATAGRHHRTNQEVLVDILAMSQCQYLLHGLSAVSEATIYVAGPSLYSGEHAMNLEFHQFYQRKRQKQKNRGKEEEEVKYGSAGDEPMPVQVFRDRLLSKQ